jgi:hypothetical protein
MGSSLARFLFSYGKPVTSYDLASLVNTALNQMPAAPSPKDIGVIDILIQNEMEKFISVEEMEDLSELNVVGAKPLTIDDLEVRSSNLPSYGFEDPRTWAGDALDSEKGDPAQAEPVSDAKVTPPAPSHDAPVSPDESSSKMAWMVIIVLLTLVVIGLILLIAVFVLNKG